MTVEKTIQRLEARLQDNPKSLLFARLADFYLKVGRTDEAIDLCLKGVNHHPSYVTGNFILGKAYLAKGDYEKAEEAFKKVLSHESQHLSAHKFLGDLMAKMGWENKAAIHYRDILRIDPLEEGARRILETLSPGEEFASMPVPEEEPKFEEKKWIRQLDEVFPEKMPDSEKETLETLPTPSEEDLDKMETEESLSTAMDQESKREEDEEFSPDFLEEKVEKESDETPLLYEEEVPVEKYEEGTPLIHSEEPSQEIAKPEISPEKPPEEKAEDETPSVPLDEEPEKKDSEEKEDKKIVTPTLGEIYVAQGQYTKAIRVYETLLKKNPGEERYRQKIEELKGKLNGSSSE